MPDLTGHHVLVTGGAGFIGAHVVQSLLAAGAEVVVADLRDPGDGRIETVVGDLRDPANVDKALRPGMTGVVHLAALTSVLESIDSPWEVHTTNVDMTALLLERARTVEVTRFVAASTNAVVGDVGHQRISEGMPLRPLTPYGSTKAASEMLMSAYTACYDMSCCPLRLTNVFGPGMGLKDSMVPRLMRAALEGRRVQVYGDGEQVRDLLHVFDVADAFLRALTHGWSEPVIIGTGRSHSVNELVRATREVTGNPLPVDHIAARPGEMPAVLVDPSRAHSLGWTAETSLTEGLRTAWDSFRSGAATSASSG